MQLENRYLVLMIVIFTNLPFTHASNLDDYRRYCIRGASMTGKHLNLKINDHDKDRLINRCIGGTSKTLAAYEAEVNKPVYGCGVGIGAAANFHNRLDILNNKQAMTSIIKACAK